MPMLLSLDMSNPASSKLRALAMSSSFAPSALICATRASTSRSNPALHGSSSPSKASGSALRKKAHTATGSQPWLSANRCHGSTLVLLCTFSPSAARAADMSCSKPRRSCWFAASSSSNSTKEPKPKMSSFSSLFAASSLPFFFASFSRRARNCSSRSPWIATNLCPISAATAGVPACGSNFHTAWGKNFVCTLVVPEAAVLGKKNGRIDRATAVPSKVSMLSAKWRDPSSLCSIMSHSRRLPAPRRSAKCRTVHSSSWSNDVRPEV
mmetsp:Transcript_28930/g.96326  ORF Transcript_28930/g.96326 Transcript_28930/m.96326 type:complete len:267 (+) Transcript_28930:1685-2485(+)